MSHMPDEKKLDRIVELFRADTRLQESESEWYRGLITESELLKRLEEIRTDATLNEAEELIRELESEIDNICVLCGMPILESDVTVDSIDGSTPLVHRTCVDQ